MKYERRGKIPGGIWKDGLIATRPMAEEKVKKCRDRDHHGRLLDSEVADVCLNCEREDCTGVCKRAAAALRRKTP